MQKFKVRNKNLLSFFSWRFTICQYFWPLHSICDHIADNWKDSGQRERQLTMGKTMDNGRDYSTTRKDLLTSGKTEDDTRDYGHWERPWTFWKDRMAI